MTKENWIKHLEKTEGLIRPSAGGNKELWKTARERHMETSCPECLDRAKTRRRNASAKDKESVYRSRRNMVLLPERNEDA